MKQIAAIETVYKGHRFRSRLEARWAVFFDSAGVEWKYEPEGFRRWMVSDFDGDHYISYLPDFHLPASNTWVEVKGSDELLKKDAERIWYIVEHGSPLPGVDDSAEEGSARGLLLLGDIPTASWGITVHTLIQNCTTAPCIREACFVAGDSSGSLRALPLVTDWVHGLLGLDGVSLMASPAELTTKSRTIQTARSWRRVVSAYEAARQARFEHGQVGAPTSWR